MEFGKIGSGVEQGQHGDASGPGGVLVAMGGQLLMKRAAGLSVGTRLGQRLVSFPQGWTAITFPCSVDFLFGSHFFLITRDGEDYRVTPTVWSLFPGFSYSLFPWGLTMAVAEMICRRRS